MGQEIGREKQGSMDWYYLEGGIKIKNNRNIIKISEVTPPPVLTT